jgi:hypothetical protein
MSEIDQNLHALEHDVVRLSAFNIGDEPDAASIVLVLRAVQSLSRRQAVKWVNFLHFDRYFSPSAWGAASGVRSIVAKKLLMSRSQASRPPFRVTLLILSNKADQDSGGLQLESAPLHSATGKRLFRHFFLAAFYRASGIRLYYHRSGSVVPEQRHAIFYAKDWNFESIAVGHAASAIIQPRHYGFRPTYNLY